MPAHDYHDDDDDKPERSGQKWDEFDCPGCNANNPVEPPFAEGSEILCNYCGMEWEVRVRDNGKYVLKER